MTFGNIRNPFLWEVGAGHALLPQSPDARRCTEQPELLDPSLYGPPRRPQGLRHGPQGQVVHTERGRPHRLLPRRAVVSSSPPKFFAKQSGKAERGGVPEGRGGLNKRRF